MLDLIFSNNGAWFAVPALLGTLVFVLRVAMMLLGMAGHDLHLDFGHDVGHGGVGHSGTGAAHATDSHGDSSHAFTVLSIQSVAAFLMGFGWGGVASLNGSHWSWPVSVVIAIMCGVAMVWVLGLLLKGVHDLQSSGTMPIASALGAEGDVYVSVPPRGQGLGQVRVVVQERQRIYNAVSDTGPVPTQARIRVVGINDDNTLTVMPV